jgi:hypothetical protein
LLPSFYNSALSIFPFNTAVKVNCRALLEFFERLVEVPISIPLHWLSDPQLGQKTRQKLDFRKS